MNYYDFFSLLPNLFQERRIEIKCVDDDDEDDEDELLLWYG